MMRLIKRGLMFGNLIEVSSPALVARYNRALEHLTGKSTALTEFHIDICGYSPEVGHELSDDLYLNPLGCNQQFIFLTPEQKTAPLLSSKFSTSRSILKSYIEDNEEELFALTAREAVTGELLNSVFEVASPADLFQINTITIEADTIGERVASAKTLQTQIDRFMNERDAWWDDVLISDMIEIGKQTGNIVRHPINLKTANYKQGNFYTSLFGGLYVFRDVDVPTVIACDPSLDLSGLPVEQAFSFADRKEIATFLHDLDLAELIVSSRDSEISAIVKQKIDFITIATAAEQGEDLSNLHRQQLRAISRKYASYMPEEYHGLMQIWRWASLGGAFPNLSAEHAAYFYALRSTQHDDRDLVNMLLADLSPLDFRQLFICHKDAFYKLYQTYSESKKAYVAQFLADEYAIDKAGARDALFGPEPDMSEPSIPVQPPRRKARRSEADEFWNGGRKQDQSQKRRKKKRDDDDDDDRRQPRRKSKKRDSSDYKWADAKDRARKLADLNRQDLEDLRWLRDNWKD